MYYFLISIHCVICLFLITVVLLQHGKGADVGATFGGGGDSILGTGGVNTMLTKITTVSAILFMITSLLLVKFTGTSLMVDPIQLSTSGETVVPQVNPEVNNIQQPEAVDAKAVGVEQPVAAQTQKVEVEVVPPTVATPISK